MVAASFTSYVDEGSLKNREIASDADIDRSKLATDSKKFAQRFDSLKIFDSTSDARLPFTAASDDLAMVLGDSGSGEPTASTAGDSIQTSDAKAAAGQTQKARFTFHLPPEYLAGGTITLVAYAGMITTVSDTTATIDFEVFHKDPTDYTHGTDLCTTSATSINSLTLAAKSFTITPTGLIDADELSVLMTIAINDGATGTAVIGVVSQLYWLLQVKG